MRSRIISGIIALGYLITAYVTDGSELAWRVAIFLIPALACIWFSDALGGYTGLNFVGPAITRTTPGCFVAFVGWVILLLPVIIRLISSLSGRK